MASCLPNKPKDLYSDTQIRCKGSRSSAFCLAAGVPAHSWHAAQGRWNEASRMVVCCGIWSQCCGSQSPVYLGATGILLGGRQQGLWSMLPLRTSTHWTGSREGRAQEGRDQSGSKGAREVGREGLLPAFRRGSLG